MNNEGKIYVFDIEADNLLRDVSKIHCISIEDMTSGARYHYEPSQISEGLEKLKEADVLIGHNIKGYDIPAIQKLFPDWKYKDRVIDTLILGCILDPEAGILSLENWASKLKLKEQKVQNEDWSVYTENMGKRCQSDVSINVAVARRMMVNPHYPAIVAHALNVEQSVSAIHARQAVFGVRFDILRALDIVQELDDKIEERRETIVEGAPRTCLLPGIAKKNQEQERLDRIKAIEKDEIHKGLCLPYKKSGEYTVATRKYFGETTDDNVGYEKVVGPYSKVEFKEFNPNSGEEVKELLLDLGWKPTEWNFKKERDGSYKLNALGQRIPSSPKLSEDSYDSLPEGFGRTVAEFMMMNHRRRFLLNPKDNTKGALAIVAERGDGRVSAEAFTCGTPTSRYRHSGVVCNIPRPSSPYGKELRSCFTVERGNLLVGVDLSGIEARMLAHFLLRGNYTDARKTADLILSPDKGNDFHSYNAKQWGVSRDLAKSGLYALLYGAGAVKLANTLGKDESMGARLKKQFFQAHPGISELIDDLETAYGRNGNKHIKGIDGRPIFIRGRNKLLNSLLQSSAAYVFKMWMIALDNKIQVNKMRDHIQQVIAYHDEIQYEVSAYGDPTNTLNRANTWASMCEEAATRVGAELDIKVPIQAEAKVGLDWAGTH